MSRHSQEYSNNVPAGNLLLCAGIWSSGISYVKTLRMLKLMNVVAINQTTFLKHSKYYVQPIIYNMWQSEQHDVLKNLRQSEEGAILSGDGRCDSPGHSAKYGTYVFLDMSNNKIADIQLVQSNEVGGSYHLEKEGFQRAIHFLKNFGIAIKQVVTDRHPQIAKYIRLNMPETQHRFDAWHIAKSKLLCIIVILFLSNIIMFKSMGDFTKCEHEDIPPEVQKRKKWITVSDPFVLANFEKIICDKRFVKDVQKVSTLHQTSSLEAFNSLILQFAPKQRAFHFLGMLTR
ncbi:uncharacterized protein LOC144749972 [Ciona intestinalis]